MTIPTSEPALSPLTTNQDLDPARLREAFGHFPSGVVAVAAEVDGRLIGLAASSFTSVSLDPPLVSFSVATTSKTWPTLRRSPHLGVTVLADHHGAVCRQLAGPVERRFDGLPVTVTGDGAVLLDDGLARFDCTIHQEVQAGDHTIVLLALHSVEAPGRTGAGSMPLVFHRSGFTRITDALGGGPDVPGQVA
jgi:flavin reductase (DIM6/NTAB) family NADH-FMN oxidoreductase RutF